MLEWVDEPIDVIHTGMAPSTQIQVWREKDPTVFLLLLKTPRSAGGTLLTVISARRFHSPFFDRRQIAPFTLPLTLFNRYVRCALGA